MAKKHLFALNAPVNWPINRKEQKWVIRPNPGPHPLKRCLPLGLLVIKLLNYAKTARESRIILRNGEILINNQVRKNPKFPVGVMDIIEIKNKNEYFRLFINPKNKYELIRLNKKEINLKMGKIINKKTLKGGLMQLNLYDGRNLLVNKDVYHTGDSLLINLGSNEIISHLKLENGAYVYLIGGKYTGNIGKIESILGQKKLQPSKISVIIGNKKIETLKKYAFVISEDFLKVKNE